VEHKLCHKNKIQKLPKCAVFSGSAGTQLGAVENYGYTHYHCCKPQLL